MTAKTGNSYTTGTTTFSRGSNDFDGGEARLTDVYPVKLVRSTGWLIYDGAQCTPRYDVIIRQSIEVAGEDDESGRKIRLCSVDAVLDVAEELTGVI